MTPTSEGGVAGDQHIPHNALGRLLQPPLQPQTHPVVESIERVLDAGRPGLKSSKLCDSRQTLSLFVPHFPHPSMETVSVPTYRVVRRFRCDNRRKTGI